MSGRGAERILEFIEWLARRYAPATLAEITQAMAVPKSSALLLLRSLVSAGYVLRQPDGLYVLIRLPGEPSAGQQGWGTILRVVEPVLREAVNAARESGFIAILTEGKVRYLNKLLPQREIRYDRDISHARTLHEVASGIVLLTGMSPGEREAYLAGLDDATAATVRAHVEAARRDGAFVNLKGVVEGAAGIAAPILSQDGRVVAALNISGPRERIAQDQERLKALTIAAAAQASHELAKRTAFFAKNTGRNDRDQGPSD
ncbi:IclR family transcriptional regulator domain-containing protein [Bosea vaviloviae]|uniref:IclR family transcriptional regulator n=1 Tax=Bosea vaviloviae TaxID=1526658 RepID=A0A1D7TY04_9HYPH|nr:IclR family transcriptional regulator C-terminal domain-containing protein [Bosea vaviloviae]AOO80003.1 hypothetical protein BHK69_05490 [Bosea vaviloviae]